MNGTKAFGARVKELRKNRHITQETLAELIGVEPQQISRIENGACFTTFETLEKIANILQIQISELFSFSHIRTKKELLDEINESLQRQTDDKIQTIYKIIQTLIN